MLQSLNESFLAWFGLLARCPEYRVEELPSMAVLSLSVFCSTQRTTPGQHIIRSCLASKIIRKGFRVTEGYICIKSDSITEIRKSQHNVGMTRTIKQMIQFMGSTENIVYDKIVFPRISFSWTVTWQFFGETWKWSLWSVIHQIASNRDLLTTMNRKTKIEFDFVSKSVVLWPSRERSRTRQNYTWDVFIFVGKNFRVAWLSSWAYIRPVNQTDVWCCQNKSDPELAIWKLLIDFCLFLSFILWRI